MDLLDIKQYLLHQFKSEADLVAAIELISHNFTKDRSELSTYLKDERLVSAYTYFYLSTNMPKLASVLGYLGKEFSDFNDYEFVDIGTGPGTFLLSLLEHLPHNNYYGIEVSQLMLKQADKLVSGFYPKASVTLTSSLKEIPKKCMKRIGLFSHSANEMNPEQVLNYIDKLDLDEVLFIEPGIKDFFKKSLEIRDHLIQQKYHVHYPCHSNGSCPLGDDDWCHQFIKITHSPEVQRLCQLVRKDRSLLPLTIQYYAKEAKTKTSVNRVVRTFKPTKFSIEMQLCHGIENENKLIHLQQLTRNLDKQQIKKFSSIHAGEEISFDVVKELPNNVVRGDIHES